MANKATATSKAAGQEPIAPAAWKTAGTTARKSNKIYCYIGPNIRGYLHTGQVFRGEREDILRELAEAVGKHPLIKTLLIPGESLAMARLRVMEPGTGHYANFLKLKNELQDEARNRAEKEALANA